MQSFIYSSVAIILCILSSALSASATMNIHTRDGQIIRVSVKKSDVVRITYDEPAGTVQSGTESVWVVNENGNIYSRAGGSWRQMPGLAKDIGTGANGSVWVIGTDREPGGYGIHRWNGSNWNKIDGGAVRIAVDPNGNPWVVNENGNIYSRAGGSWRQMPGLAKDIGAGANGSVWVIGTDREPGGYGIHRWNGSNWNKIDGGAVRIAVDPNGNPWVVNENGNIYSRAGGSWRQMPGLAKDIGAGANGSVWVIGTDREPGGYGIHRWNGSNWNKIDGGAMQISVR